MLNISDWPPSDEERVFNYLRWSGYRSERYKLLYVSTPKVACTSLKWWFASLEDCSKALNDITDSAESNPDQVVHEMHKVAPHVTGLQAPELMEALTSDSYFRFAVVRNPYKRIFSAWQSKLLLQEPQQVGPYLQRDFYHQPLKDASDIASAFEGFLEHLASQEAPSYWDQHWTPQVALLRPDLINYSMLIKIEQSEQLSKALAEHVGQYIPDPFAERRSNESLIPYLPEFITQRSAELIRKLYAEDFVAFGYDRALPETKGTFSEAELSLALRAVKLIRGRHQRLGERTAKIASLNQTAAELQSKIASLDESSEAFQTKIAYLNTAISEGGARITSLGLLVIERETEISRLNTRILDLEATVSDLNLNSARVVEYDEKLTELRHALVERDGQIISLNKANSERDGQISSLRYAIVELEAQLRVFTHLDTAREGEINSYTMAIDGLKHALLERDGKVVNLNSVLCERDAQINNLKHAVVERDGEVGGLKDEIVQIILQKDAEVDSLKHEVGCIARQKDVDVEALKRELGKVLASRSWRMTSPVRRVGNFLRRTKRVLSAPSLSKTIEVLRGRRDFRNQLTLGLVRGSNLFDKEFYLANNADVREKGIDPLQHFMLHGWREQRSPSALFSVSRYLSDNQDVASARINPLVHYLKFGQLEGRSIATHSRHSSDLSDAQPVAKMSVSVVEAQVEAIRKSGKFDESYYFAMNSDLLPGQIDALRHYCEFGWREGRNPSDEFDTRSYIETYKDIKAADINPFWHYVVAGASEHRVAVPGSVVRYEGDIRFGQVDSDIKLFALYVTPQWDVLKSSRSSSKGGAQLLPDDSFGFYNVLDADTLRRQARLAKSHGFYGFCFESKESVGNDFADQPVGVFLKDKDIDLSFCLRLSVHCGLLPERLAEAVADKRYARIDGRPVLVVSLLENQDAKVLSQLRKKLAELKISAYLIVQTVQINSDVKKSIATGLCDAILDLPVFAVPGETGGFVPQLKNGVATVPYSVIVANGISRTKHAQLHSFPVYNGITLARDASAADSQPPLVYTRFGSQQYRRWLDAAIASTRSMHANDRRLLFVNAWNDWSQGLFLEPDKVAGYGRVNETSCALLDIESNRFMPKVSVLVPNYNHERFLRRRLDSIYAQTYQNIEVILMDDCSTDQSRRVLSEYADKYPDVTIKLFNETNSGGVFRQWAKGIKAATGDLVWIAESDDYCDEHFLQALVRTFEDEAVMLAYARCEFVTSDEVVMEDEFHIYVSDLEGSDKWRESYVETAHNEVRTALGIKNTIPNASGVIFKRPVNMPLLDDETWLSMRVAGDWVFYLHLIRGGKIAYSIDGTNFFRRYVGSTAQTTYQREVFYYELGLASRTIQALYDVPLSVMELCEESSKRLYDHNVGNSQEEFLQWYRRDEILKARANRKPNIMVSTIGFYPGGAEILPIRLANEFKRQGHSVFLLSAGLTAREDGVRRMLRSDVPLVETSDLEEVKSVIRHFGVEAMNTHQWHIQKSPSELPDVFAGVKSHVASLHGMIEHGAAFAVTEEQLRAADSGVTTWVYTAEKNIVPFAKFSLYENGSQRFVKVPNGLQPPNIVAIERTQLGIPQDAFVLCCVSRAIPDKGWEETIRAVELARELTGRDIRLLLVGNGPVYDEYLRDGAPDFVYLAGFSDNSVGHYAAADMGVMLTKFKSESFPLTIVDCLFAGRPYLASDVGDIRNMLTIDEHIAGEVIALDDWEIPIKKAARVIASFATDKAQYLHALGLVKEVSNRYRIDAVAEQYVSLFERDIRASRKIDSAE
ncbi:glycoside hydrolase family 99-like domain-containing protein [Pseudomonas sp. NPDC088429]|uniref:glycoside hydrolase family 99-like domain-containing protein n=1 Tax=Pseudomonas sp. NPDC088429 TaxID=3364455 RepID=UPI0037F26064